MTKHELIDAYAGGRIGRRDFVQRLSALGVSSAAALAYAHSLAPSVSAAGAGSPTRFIVRAQDGDPDDEYGGPVDPVDLIEAIIDVVEALIAEFADLVDEFPALESVVDFLEAALGFLQDLLAAVGGTARANLPTAGSVAIVRFAQASEQALIDVAEDFDALAGLYTYAVPVLEELEARRALMSIAMVTARQAAYVRGLAGLSPAPAALEQPLTPDEAQAELGASGA